MVNKTKYWGQVEKPTHGLDNKDLTPNTLLKKSYSKCKNFKVTDEVINRYNDSLQCHCCNDVIEINDNYFILYHEDQNYTELVICNNICLSDAIEYIINK